MRSISLFGALLYVLAAGAATAAPAGRKPAPMPTVLFASRDSTRPIWIEASAAVDEAGRVRTKVLGENAATLQQQLDEPAATGCLPFERVDIMYAMPPPRATLNDAIGHSRTKLLARVTNRAFGLYSGIIPGQLVQVVPVKSFGRALPSRHYYFFVPVGEFRFGNRLVCKEDAAYAELPEIGGEVFLFIAGPPEGTEANLLFVYGPGDIVPVGRNGSLSLPRQYRLGESETKSDMPRSKADLLERLDRLPRKEVSQ